MNRDIMGNLVVCPIWDKPIGLGNSWNLQS